MTQADEIATLKLGLADSLKRQQLLSSQVARVNQQAQFKIDHVGAIGAHESQTVQDMRNEMAHMHNVLQHAESTAQNLGALNQAIVCQVTEADRYATDQLCARSLYSLN